MFRYLRHEWMKIIAILFFLSMSVWWCVLYLQVDKSNLQHQLFAAVYGLMALYGGILGILISSKWGGIKSLVGRALVIFSLGLFAQEFGQLVYSYYIFFLNIEVPYPSIGDFGYFGSIFFYIAGLILIARVSGVKANSKNLKRSLPSLLIPILILFVSYWHFLKNYEFDFNAPLTVFLDFGYPMGQAIYISFALQVLLLSQGVLGGIMKNNIRLIIIALGVQYVADYMFLYQAYNGGWYAGGINDYIYLLAYLLMSIGLLQFNESYRRVTSSMRR